VYTNKNSRWNDIATCSDAHDAEHCPYGLKVIKTASVQEVFFDGLLEE
jgi:hypothetical protein